MPYVTSTHTVCEACAKEQVIQWMQRVTRQISQPDFDQEVLAALRSRTTGQLHDSMVEWCDANDFPLEVMYFDPEPSDTEGRCGDCGEPTMV